MKLELETKMRNINNSLCCTIPHYFCKEHKIELNDYFLVGINDGIFDVKICGTSYNKIIFIPVYFKKKLNLEKNRKIRIIFVKKVEKRKKETKIVVMDNLQYLDIYYSLQIQQFHTKRKLIIFKLDNNKILICGKGCARRVLIPRYLLLNEYVFEVFGLYQGEGYRKQPKDAARVEFVNSDLKVIKFFLEHFREIFNLHLDS